MCDDNFVSAGTRLACASHEEAVDALINQYWILDDTARKADARSVYDVRICKDSDVKGIETVGSLNVNGNGER